MSARRRKGPNQNGEVWSPSFTCRKKREEEAISYEGKNKEGLSQSGETQGVWSRFIQSPAPIKKIGGAWMSLARRCVSL